MPIALTSPKMPVRRVSGKRRSQMTAMQPQKRDDERTAQDPKITVATGRGFGEPPNTWWP